MCSVSVLLVCRRQKRGGDGKEMDSMRKRKEEEEEEEIDRSRGTDKQAAVAARLMQSTLCFIPQHNGTDSDAMSFERLRYRAQELCESQGGRPGLPVPNKPNGFCGCKVTLKFSKKAEKVFV